MNREKLHPIMFAGTGSDVGKSIIATGFCRIFKQDGYTPAPFKAQNMALNSFITKEGLEIGRAQAVQAEAAEVECETDMNPILLKPSGNKTSQVVLNGKVVGNQSAYSYFRKEGRQELRDAVENAFKRISKRYNPIVLEGAGSIAEINLKDIDLVNIAMAKYAKSPVILIADIDRGGVFASIYGSIKLLAPEEQKLIKGVIINKFRGDIRLFDSGIDIIEQTCGVPVLGVLPYYSDIYIEEEDSVVLESKSMQASHNKVNVVIILLKHLSNYTDFNSLERDPRVHLFYSNNTDEIEKADIIIIPGSKNTISDMYELRKNGVAKSIIKAYKANKTIIGICGGYQMMGQVIKDPYHVEGEIEQIPGLGILPTTTTLLKEKTTRQTRFYFNNNKDVLEGYEIHMGETTPIEQAKPVNKLLNGETDGTMINNRCFGTYIHGILDNDSVIDFIIDPFQKKLNRKPVDIKTFKREQYDKLADHIRKYVDIEKIYQIMREGV